MTRDGLGYRPAMSNPSEERPGGVPDEELPEDLVPDEDNPLATGLPAGETVDGLLVEGKRAEQMADTDEANGDRDESVGADLAPGGGSDTGQGTRQDTGQDPGQDPGQNRE